MNFVETISKKVWLKKFGYPLPGWAFKDCKEKVEPDVKLNEGDIICDVCKGWGRISGKLCPKCFGNRKLDWIENVLGVSCTTTTSVSSSSSCSTYTTITEWNEE
jgi:hypothetical protein